jgi:hypothetical protein
MVLSLLMSQSANPAALPFAEATMLRPRRAAQTDCPVLKPNTLAQVRHLRISRSCPGLARWYRQCYVCGRTHIVRWHVGCARISWVGAHVVRVPNMPSPFRLRLPPRSSADQGVQRLSWLGRGLTICVGVFRRWDVCTGWVVLVVGRKVGLVEAQE